MAKAKKNIFQEFMQDDYIPEKNQYIVKYVAGRGNNLHEIEDIDGSQYLVSMPKKYRQTVWLKKHDCLVIDPVAEGNKVRGEIKCLIPVKNVINLIQTGEWIPPCSSDKNNLNTIKDLATQFFKKHLEERTETTDLPSEFIPTDSEDESEEEEEEEDSQDEVEEEGGGGDEEEDEEEDSEPINLENNVNNDEITRNIHEETTTCT